ncbi:MAG: undecaprenyldiphospho-muramoylpentapeptide beta-N-acetylglucosaminyltransferase [Gammaproteobacteria bacterium]
MTARRIMIVAGGTGGHVFPGLAVAERLREAGAEVTWLGTRNGLESRLVPDAGIDIDWISISGLRGKGMATLLMAPFKIVKACLQSAAVIRRRKPDAVLGMGGFVSGPGGLMARLLGRPLLLHEQNARAGLTNRLLSRIASRVFSAFPNSFPSGVKDQVVGNPVRASLSALPEPAKRLDCDCENRPCRLLVIGGSQGALVLNQIVPEAISLIEPERRPEIIHQAGPGTIAEARERYGRLEIDCDLRSFIDDMAEVYGWADLVICRAGALTVSEIAAVGIAAIFVPLPHAVDDHQTANARYLTEAGAGILMPQTELDAEHLADAMRVFLGSPEQRLAMAEKARARGKTDADSLVAEACLAAAGGAA